MWPLVLLLLLCCLSDSATLRGPREVIGQAGRNLTVTCDYNIEYKKHRKWWCQKTALMHCQNRVHTTGAKQVVRKDRVTIRDDQGQHRFTVTMERLRDNDAGTYWCGVDTDKFDLAFPVRVTIAPGSAALRGPRDVVGQAGSFVAVICQYDAGYERHRKWWCRGAALGGCSNRVETTGTEQVVRKDRVTIRDDQRQRRFTVTMERLRDDDAGTYWCGVEPSDQKSQVTVTITPAPTTTTASTTTTTTPNAPRTAATTEETTDAPSVTRALSTTTSLLRSVHFLLLVFLKVPLLLFLMGAVVWASWPQRGPRKQT